MLTGMPSRDRKPLFEFAGRTTARCGVFLIFLLSTLASNAAENVSTNSDADLINQTTNHIGSWIWGSHPADKQTCRLWKSFIIPGGSAVSRAILRITVDNGYRLFLDGREIGRGSDWRTLTIYDVKWLLSPGQHVIAVEGFNDRLEAGLIFGLEIERVDQSNIEIRSDESWYVVPSNVSHWTDQKRAGPGWEHATVVGSIHSHPWENWPIGVSVEQPILPLHIHFWQSGWFQLSMAILCGLALLVSLWLMAQLAAQSKAQTLLQLERVRIARDIHDDLGARLTEMLLLGEVSQRELPGDSPAKQQLCEICEKARGLSHAMDEVVWAVNSRRDTMRDFVNYVCKYAQFYLKSTPIRCRLDVDAEIPEVEFDLPVRRNLLLAVKEALNNAAKHSGASEIFLRIHRRDSRLVVTIEDNGHGFDPATMTGERNGMGNMWQRMTEIGGQCRVESQPGFGCLVQFVAPFNVVSQPRWLKWLRRADAQRVQTEIQPQPDPAVESNRA